MTTAAFVVCFAGLLLLAGLSRLGRRESVGAKWAWFGLEAVLILVVFGVFWWMRDNGAAVTTPFVLFVLLSFFVQARRGAALRSKV